MSAEPAPPEKEESSAEPSPRAPSAAPLMSSAELAAMRGPYEENYETLASIGKGAFGFVKLGKRRKDGREVCSTSILVPLQITRKCFIANNLVEN